MANYEIGDRVRRAKGTGNCTGAGEGVIYSVVKLSNGQLAIGERAKNLSGEGCTCYSQWELVSKKNNQTQMNIKEKFALAFKTEPDKSFRRAEITDGDDFLTEDGRNIFLSWLLKKNGDAFKKEVVDDLLKKDVTV
jgi:hypothetical protein